MLFFCAKTGLIDRLAARPHALDELSQLTAVESDRLLPLLRAAAALRLLEERADGRWGLGMLGAAQIGNDGLRALILHHDALYRDLVDPLAMLQAAATDSRLSEYWAYARRQQPQTVDTAEVAPYSAVMSSSQRMLSEQLVDLSIFRGAGRFMDVGGGNASLAIALAQRWKNLEITVVDLPAVTELARANVAEAGLADRINVCGLNFFKDPLPAEQDIVSLVRVLHDHDDEDAAALIAAAKAALRPGGSLLVAEPMAGSDDAGRLIDAYFSVYLLAMGQGRPRSVAELSRMLRRAGLSEVRRRGRASPIICSVVTAQQPQM